ncbi:hypothetical protein GPALN_009791 [Globodera pallida]|nr:hypothetical protein GPALN_009791 [Globodera pallida]
MKFNIQQLICFGLLNYVFTFPNDLFDELWQINESAPQASDNPIGSQPKIKIEPDEEQFHERWQNKSAQKGIVKIEHEQHYGAVNVKGTAKIKHEPHYEDVKVKLEQNDESKKDFIKVKVEEVGPSVDEHGQRLTTTSPKTEDGAQTSMAPKRQLPNVLDANTKRSRQIRAKNKMPQNESSEEDNYSKETEESHETFEESNYSESEDLMELNHKNDQQNLRKRICHSEEGKLEIVKKFLEMKQNIYNKVTNYSDDEKLKIVKELMRMKSEHSENFDQKKAELKRNGLKNSYRHKIDETVAKELGLSFVTIYKWKRELSQTEPQYKHLHSEQKELMQHGKSNLNDSNFIQILSMAIL